MNTRIFSYFLFLGVKLLSSIFYRYEVKWLNQVQKKADWVNIRLIVFLNHTSLFEPLFIRVTPNSFIWKMSKDLVAPGADITLNRPIVGWFFKKLVPGAVPISRKKDSTWSNFLNRIRPESVVAILPEGRMKRPGGLDKHGKPMSIRGGIAEILQGLNQGKALFVYSGGLHHVQSPGQKWPRLFKKIKVNLELKNIEQYKQSLNVENMREFRRKLVADLNYRLQHMTPKGE